MRNRTKTTPADPLKAYAEACSTMRHYPVLSSQVRLTSVGQGIVLLGAWSVAVEKAVAWTEVAIPIIGLLFTYFLYRFHLAYFKATDFFYKVASKIEVKFFDEDCRPITDYDRHHDKEYSSPMKQLTAPNAPFVPVGVAFFVALIISLVLLGKQKDTSSVESPSPIATSSVIASPISSPAPSVIASPSPSPTSPHKVPEKQKIIRPQ